MNMPTPTSRRPRERAVPIQPVDALVVENAQYVLVTQTLEGLKSAMEDLRPIKSAFAFTCELMRMVDQVDALIVNLDLLFASIIEQGGGQ